MLVHGQDRASVMSAIACRASLLPFSLSFCPSRRAQPRSLLVPTLVWLIATLRILLRSSRLPTLPAGSDGPVHFAPRQEKARRRFSLTDLALFYFFTRK